MGNVLQRLSFSISSIAGVLEYKYVVHSKTGLQIAQCNDTTAIMGDLLTRLNIPIIGIIDGDRDYLTSYIPNPFSTAIAIFTDSDWLSNVTKSNYPLR